MSSREQWVGAVEGTGSVCRQACGKNFYSIYWFVTIPIIVEGGDVQRGVLLSLSPIVWTQSFFLVLPHHPGFISTLQMSHSVIFTCVFVYILFQVKQHEGRIMLYLSSMGFGVLQAASHYLLNEWQERRKAGRKKRRNKEKGVSQSGRLIL